MTSTIATRDVQSRRGTPAAARVARIDGDFLPLALSPTRAKAFPWWKLALASIVAGSAAAVSGSQPLAPPERATTPRVRITSSELGVNVFSDLRFDSRDEMLIASVREGVVRLRFEPEAAVVDKGIAVSPHGGMGSFAIWVARSDHFIAAAQLVGSISWAERGSEAIQVFHGFDAVLDIDLFGDKVAVMAARRDERSGPYAPDGAIVSVGTLGDTLKGLRPLYVSVTGPGAPSLELCYALLLGNVRFLEDGRLIVQPGVEPGIYRYSPDGVLEKTWSTEALGIDADCALDDSESTELSANLDLQIAWINQRTIVDDIIPLVIGPGVIIRKVRDDVATWELLILHPRGQVERFPLPFRRPADHRLKADTDGERIAFLIFNPTNRAQPAPHEILMLPMPGVARSASSEGAR